MGTIWDSSYSNGLGHLCQCVGKGPTITGQRFKGTNNFGVICFADIPRDLRKGITFKKVVCKIRPEKEDPNRTRITIIGNRVVYAGDARTKTASLKICKLVINSVLSHKGAKFITYDIRNSYLATSLDYPEYVKIKLTDIPQDFIDKYNLHGYVHEGWVYLEIRNSVYGLPQFGSLSNDL